MSGQGTQTRDRGPDADPNLCRPSVRFQGGPRAARAADTAARPALTLGLPCRAAPTPVGWREHQGIRNAATSSSPPGQRGNRFLAGGVPMAIQGINTQVERLSGAVGDRLMFNSAAKSHGQTTVKRSRLCGRHGVLTEPAGPGRQAAVHGVLLGPARPRMLGRDVPAEEGCRPRVAGRRGQGGRGPRHRPAARPAAVRAVRDGDVAAQPRDGAEHAAELHLCDQQAHPAGVPCRCR